MLQRNIRTWYGLTWEQYATIRNDLLDKRNTLTVGELHNDLLNRIVIDLVGRRFLCLKHSSVNNVRFTLTEKAMDQVLLAFSKRIKGLPADPHLALIYLRNLNLLHE